MQAPTPKPFTSILTESKFRVPDPWAVRAVCEERDARMIGIEQQTDTYFQSPNGRLQLRESTHSGAFLLSWAEGQATKMQVSDPDTLRKILTAQLGVKLTIKKRREIFLVEDALVNLDDVAKQGYFLKFEGLYEKNERRLLPIGLQRMHELQQLFGLTMEDVERRSYYSLQKRADRAHNLEYDAFTNVNLLAPGGALRERTRTETYVGTYE